MMPSWSHCTSSRELPNFSGNTPQLLSHCSVFSKEPIIFDFLKISMLNYPRLKATNSVVDWTWRFFTCNSTDTMHRLCITIIIVFLFQYFQKWTSTNVRQRQQPATRKFYDKSSFILKQTPLPWTVVVVLQPICTHFYSQTFVSEPPAFKHGHSRSRPMSPVCRQWVRPTKFPTDVSESG